MMIMNDNDGWLMIIRLLDCDYHSPFAQMVLGLVLLRNLGTLA